MSLILALGFLLSTAKFDDGMPVYFYCDACECYLWERDQLVDSDCAGRT